MKMIELINEAAPIKPKLMKTRNGKFVWQLPNKSTVGSLFNTQQDAINWAKANKSKLISPAASSTTPPTQPATTTTTTSTTGTASRGISDIASQTLGGLGKVIAAPFGGLVHGYKTARSGGTFGKSEYRPDQLTDVPRGTTTTVQSNQNELAQLQAIISAMDARLKKAGI